MCKCSVAEGPGEEGGTEGGAQQGQQGRQVLLGVGTQGSQAIRHMCQPQLLTGMPQGLQAYYRNQVYVALYAAYK